MLSKLKSTAPVEKLPTYFTYTDDELKSFKSLTSSQKITKEELYFSDKTAFDLVILDKSTDVLASKVFAYLAVAQSDAANLSFNTHGKYLGNLSLLRKKILCEFFPTRCTGIVIAGQEDEYSSKIAEIVMSKVNERIEIDDKQTKPYEQKIGKDYWNGSEPMIGREVGSWKTWAITSSDQFRAEENIPFNSPEFSKQLATTKTALKNITVEQRNAVIFWAGGPGTKTPPGLWLEIADEHMNQEKVSLEKVLQVRAILTVAMADAFISCFDSKYSYWVKRPFMLDKTIQTVMPTPNHPSYPDGHATLSAAAATILSYYFPEEKSTWESKSHEAADSRLWGGIHYPYDNEQGYLMGQKVGEAVLNKLVQK
ncbi:MAG: vanadium-dependent haloperoxidase [bacterium]|nr:vanadium-dependent haloperoxidase [bacterium]